jgi:heme-degrading monooxygenase HmoA
MPVKGGVAMIKVLLERKVPKKNFGKLIGYLIDLRAAALRQPGYVGGETLIKGEDPVDVLVISTWISEEHWKAWTTREQRIDLYGMIAGLIEGDVKVSVYKVPLGQ